MYFNEITDDMINECKSTHVLLTPGECTYEVISAEEHTARQSGNKMPKLVLSVQDIKGRQAKVFDYLISYKLVKFLLCHDMNDAITNRYLSVESLVGLKGFCNIKHEPDLKGDMQNKIHYYISAKDKNKAGISLDLPENTTRIKKQTSPLPEFDDDIPF